MPTLVGEKIEGGVRSRYSQGIVEFEQDYHFTVEADHKYQNRFDILECPGLPRTGLTTIGQLMCKSVNADKEPLRPTRWHVVCMFSSRVEEGTAPSTPQQGNPTDWIPYGQVNFEPLEEVYKRDLDGKPFVNTAGIPFNEGLIIQRRIASVDFVQFEKLGNQSTLDTILGRAGTINSEPFLNREKYAWLLQVNNARIGTFYGLRCVFVDYTLSYKGWPKNTANLKGHWHRQQANLSYHSFTNASNPTQVGNYHYFKVVNEETDMKTWEHPVFLGPTGKRTVDNLPFWVNFRDNEELDFNNFLRIRPF